MLPYILLAALFGVSLLDSWKGKFFAALGMLVLVGWIEYSTIGITLAKFQGTLLEKVNGVFEIIIVVALFVLLIWMMVTSCKNWHQPTEILTDDTEPSPNNNID